VGKNRITARGAQNSDRENKNDRRGYRSQKEKRPLKETETSLGEKRFQRSSKKGHPPLKQDLQEKGRRAGELNEYKKTSNEKWGKSEEWSFPGKANKGSRAAGQGKRAKIKKQNGKERKRRIANRSKKARRVTGGHTTGG